jgi:hypothetical protein
MRSGKILFYRKNIIGLSACLALGACISNTVASQDQHLTGCDSISSVYTTTNNSYQKINAIRQLAEKNDVCQDALTTVILNGLSNDKISVVEEAILWSGNKKVATAAPALLDLFQSASRKFSGNQARLESKIIDALGSIDSKETLTLFSDLLKKGNIDSNMEKVLSSMSVSSSQKLISDLKSFSQKISEILGSMQNTPENSYKFEKCKKLLTMANTLINNDASR